MQAFISLAVAPETCGGFPLLTLLLLDRRQADPLGHPTPPLWSLPFFLFSLMAFSPCPSLEREQALRMSARGFSLETGLMDALWLRQQEALVMWTFVMFLPPEAADAFSSAFSQLFARYLHQACRGDQGPVGMHLVSGSEIGPLPHAAHHPAVVFYTQVPLWRPHLCCHSHMTYLPLALSFHVKNNSSLCIPIHRGTTASCKCLYNC